MDIGYQKAQDSISRWEYSDNHMRTFAKIPKFESYEIEMLRDFVDKNEITGAIIYLTEKRFGYTLSIDISEFIVREIMRGNL